MEAKKRLGERLRIAREKANLKQNEAARKLGVHNSTLAKYESGEREPDIETLHKLAELYDVPASLLVGQPYDNDSFTTIQLIEEEAKKFGLSPDDPLFKKMLVDAFELLRIARGQNKE